MARKTKVKEKAVAAKAEDVHTADKTSVEQDVKSTEEVTEEIALVVPEDTVLTTVEDDTSSDKDMRAIVELPKYETVSSGNIIRELKHEFTGFDMPTDDQIKNSFNTLDELTAYIQASTQDIVQKDGDIALAKIMCDATCSVRKWINGWVINQAIKYHEYGKACMSKLAEATGYCVATIYQIRKVAECLTMQQVYAMGMYGMNWNNIRGLAYVADDVVRNNLIESYCRQITDWNDVKQKVHANNALSDALKTIKGSSYEETASSDPAAIASVVDMSATAPEYAEMLKVLNKLITKFRAITNSSIVDAFHNAADQYFIMDTVDNAEMLSNVLTEDAKNLRELLEKTEPIISDMIVELKSLELTKPVSAADAETYDPKEKHEKDA